MLIPLGEQLLSVKYYFVLILEILVEPEYNTDHTPTKRNQRLKYLPGDCFKGSCTLLLPPKSTVKHLAWYWRETEFLKVGQCHQFLYKIVPVTT